MHMTIDPTFTHTVLDITRDKLWEQGNVEAAEKFFAGYSGLRTTAKVTNCQKDRLVEYCKAKKYDDLYAPFTKKHFGKSDIYSMSEDEWRDIFEW